MRKRTFTAVAVAGCLALLAAALGIWLLFSTRSLDGGATSVGETSVQYVSAGPDGGISLVVWSDLTGGAGQRGHSGFLESLAAGFFSSADGRRVDWEWKAPRERGGAFQINGTPHDLANGTLFLVSTKDGQVRVTQLDVDLSKVRPDKQGFEALATDQPRVAQFVTEASGRK